MSRSMPRHWRPSICTTHYTRRPPSGILIGYDGKPWRILDVEDVHPGDWSDRAREQWITYGMPNPWLAAPFRVIVTPEVGGREHMLTVEPWMHITWHELPEHYAVCAVCGDLAPCASHVQADQAKKAMRRAEKAMAILPGCCPACGEVITRRQKTHSFPGQNLLNPLAPDGVRFHQRRQCRSGAAAYEEKWVAEDPHRERSLLTLKCGGTLVVHGDGSAECHGDPECPTVYASHQVLTSCFLGSHGCPRGCSPHGHPGCRPARGLAPNGAWPA